MEAIKFTQFTHCSRTKSFPANDFRHFFGQNYFRANYLWRPFLLLSIPRSLWYARGSWKGSEPISRPLDLPFTLWTEFCCKGGRHPPNELSYSAHCDNGLNVFEIVTQKTLKYPDISNKDMIRSMNVDDHWSLINWHSILCWLHSCFVQALPSSGCSCCWPRRRSPWHDWNLSLFKENTIDDNSIVLLVRRL